MSNIILYWIPLKGGNYLGWSRLLSYPNILLKVTREKYWLKSRINNNRIYDDSIFKWRKWLVGFINVLIEYLTLYSNNLTGRKKLRNDIIKQFTALTEQDVDQLIPKEELTITVAVTHSKEEIIIYSVAGEPLVFTYNNVLYPTGNWSSKQFYMSML